MSTKITIDRVSAAEDLAACFSIRRSVFVAGQNVPASLEYDGQDDVCWHYLAQRDSQPIATARVMVLDDRYKIQRVAVLDSFRGQHIGDQLMRHVIADLRAQPDRGQRIAALSSQVAAIPFYEKLGFTVCSDIYLDANIEHRDMQASL